MIAFPKPARGSALLARRQQKSERDKYERQQKALVRKRDRWCRWPACEYRRAGMEIPLEVAHVRDKSLGGSSEARQLIYLCRLHHQGPCSLHSKDLAIVPLDMQLGTDGPCLFQQRNQWGRLETIAVERTIGISEARR